MWSVFDLHSAWMPWPFDLRVHYNLADWHADDSSAGVVCCQHTWRCAKGTACHTHNTHTWVWQVWRCVSVSLRLKSGRNKTNTACVHQKHPNLQGTSPDPPCVTPNQPLAPSQGESKFKKVLHVRRYIHERCTMLSNLYMSSSLWEVLL